MIEVNPGKARLIVDGDRCTVLHRLFNVIDRDIFTKDGLSVLVILGDRCSSKGKKSRIGKAIPE